MGPKCKMKRQVPLFKNYKEFHDSDSHALHQAQGPSEHRALCDYTGPTAMNLVLITLEGNFKCHIYSLLSQINNPHFSKWRP